MALLDDELAPDLPPLPEGFRLVEPQPAKGSAAAPARPKPSLPPLPEGFRLVDPRKAAAPAVAEEGGSMLPEFGKSIAKGAVDTVGTGLKGLAAEQAESPVERQAVTDLAGEFQRIPDMTHQEWVDWQRKAGTDIRGMKELDLLAVASQVRNRQMTPDDALTALGGLADADIVPEQKITETPLYRTGQKVQDFAAETFPTAKDYEDSWTTAIGSGLGSTVPFMAAGAIPGVGPAVGAAFGSAVSGGEAIDRAVQAGATQEQIIEAARLGRYPGLSEQVPIETLFERIPLPVAGRFAGAVAKILGQAAVEGGQEAVQQAAQNLIARYVYKPDQDITQGVAEAAGIGAIVGGGVKAGEQAVSKVIGGSEQPQPAQGSVEAPPLPEGFRPVENAVERDEGTARAPAGPVTDEQASPPATPSPATIPDEMREILRRAGNTDDMIDAMSAEEAEAEAGQYRAVTPSAFMPSAPAPVRSPDNVGVQPRVAQYGKEVLSELPIALPLSTRRGLSSDASRQRPAEIEKAPDLDIAGQRVNTEPTEAQKEAGNYKKAHVRVAGFDITIENPKGSTRRGLGPDGSEWQSILPAHYGYIKRTIGADGDHVDVYVGENPASKKIYIVDQRGPSDRGRFDEHKVILGANSIAEARDLYVRAFNDGTGNQRLGAITAVTPKALRDFLASPQSARSAYRYGKERLTAAGFPADTQGRTKRPPSLTEFIAAAGGIRDHGGELAAMDAGKIFLPGIGKLVRQNGRTLDQARALAVENGYLQDAAEGEQSTSTVDDLLVALRDDIGSYRHFSTYDDDWAGAWHAEQAATEDQRRETDARARAEAELAEVGLTRDADPEFYDRTLEMVMEGMDAADALERAAVQMDAADNVVADDTPATPYFFDEEPTDAVHGGAAFEGGPIAGDQGEVGARPEEARGASEIGEASQVRGEGGAPEEPDYDGALTAALDDQFPPLPDGFRLVEPGAEGKPQTVIPGAERISRAEEAQRAADKPLRAKAPQKDVGGLFGDDKDQTDLLDHPGAKQHPNATAPEHVDVGVDDRELSQIVSEFNRAQEAMVSDDERVTHVFDPPAKSEIVRLGSKTKVYHKEHGWMTPAEAKKVIADWKANAQAQGDDPQIRSANSRKVVLSLFDLSGAWSQPWEDAGYQVFRFDIQADPDAGDVNNFSTDFFGDWFGDFDGQDIYAILAACPCTDFASSGARHFAAKDEDGRTVASVKLVHQTLATIEYFKPAVWAVENPVGRIEKLGGLPPWRLSFDPNDVGDTYTKKTLLWGRFNADLPIAPVEPVEGSKMWAKYGGKSQATKNARSETPEGFSYSFFAANNAHDHPAMAIAWKFDRLDRDLIERAVDAGVTEEQITEAVEDLYYMEMDDAAANDAIRALIPDSPKPKREPSVKSAAKSAAMGIDEVTKGLSTLFGGSKLSSGLTFDEETYRKALPFFRAGVAHFADAGRDIAEMAKRLVRHLAQNGMDRDAIENMRPYLVRFMKDWREGVEPKGVAESEAPEIRENPVIEQKAEQKQSDVKKVPTEEAASNPVEKINTAENTAIPSSGNSLLEKLRDRLIGGDAFATINQARKFLQDNGWTAKDEAIANKEAEELIEHAVVLAAREIVKAGKARGPGVVFDRLVGLYERQPRLATRTSQSMAEQAYSTPAPLAYVASRLAGVAGADSVLEPSAGNGMLLIEANPKAVDANEINRTRADALASQGFSVNTMDATEPGLSADPVDVVIANPPFGAVRSGGVSTVYEINGHRTTAIDQAIALNALQHMKPDGRAVLIVGSVKADLSPEARSDAYNTSQKRKFYKRLYDNYNVTQHFTVDGKLYQKQGAAWPVDVIVIEGKGKSAYPYPAARVPAVVGSWAELKGYIDGSSNREGRPEDGTERVPVETGGEVPRPGAAVGRPDAGDRGRGRPDDGGRPAVQPSRPERQPEAGIDPDDLGQRDDGGNLDGDQGPERLAGGGDASGAYQRVDPKQRPPRLAESNDKGQVPYRPYSHEGARLNTLVPRALGDAMDASLAKVEQQHGDIDHFVAQSLGYDIAELKDVLSAEQIDAAALAIDNVAKGDAFVLGDQTGIGKGRVVAAAIRFAHRRGMVPIFVTEKTDLYGDMYRDLADIKWAKSLGRDPNIFMTNANTTVPLDDEAVEWVIERDEAKADGRKLPPRRGQFTKAQSVADADKKMREILSGTFKPDVVFTTYDQMNSRGEETSRRRFMDQIASRAFLIMDESHNAGGQGAKGNERAKKDAPPPRSKKFREWLGLAKAAMYSSATYAKNPAVMDLYSRTDMAKAVDDIEELPDLITKGRVPLQQVVASMLADAGQYARRERSFEGVEYALDVAEVDKENYAAFASSIRAIFKFDRAVSEFRKKWIDTWLKENAATLAMDSAVGDIAANSTEFSSIMHNLVNQMLLAIKAEAAAQRALKSLEDGEKPVVALSFTNESFLSDYANDHGTEIGDDLGLSFRDMLQRYLDRALRLTLTLDDDTKKHVFIPIEDLPGHERMLFDAAQEMVNTADVGGLPISPIDHIRHRLKEAGYRVAEITGRATMIDYGHETPKYAERPSSERGPTGKRATIKKFNDGQLDAVILNRSGSTGVSMHSSSKYKDQRRRRMILAQAEGNIDTHMQMLGRVHRTGQVIPPAYTQLAADIPAEARPTAVLMKKMASLSANTTASRKSNFTADAVDFMNEYGDLAAVQWVKDNGDLAYEMGEPIRFDDKGRLQTENPMQRLTGRIMLLDPDQQQDMLDALTQTYNMILAQKEALGENVLEATALDLEAEKIATTTMKPALGPSPFQASADLDTYRVKAPGRAMKPRDVIDAVMDSLGGDRPDSWEFARALPALQRRGQTKAEDLIRRTSEEFQSYRKWVIDGVKDAEKKQKAATDAQAQWDHWTGVVRRAPIGAQVILVSGENETPAIVTGVVKSKRKANSPVQLSTWSVRFAIPDDSRELQLPFTQLLLSPDKEADGIEIRAAGWSDRLDNLEKRFEQASTVGHENRVIATGNILAAFDQLQGKGRIIQFTDKEGVTRPGIMMPRGYSAEVYAAERQVRFKDAAQAMRFLKESEGKRLTDERENIEIVQTYKGYEFDINASRLKGGRYFTDDTVRKVYDKWTKYGQNMQATVDEATAKRLIEAMQSLGARFVATSEQEFAQQIVYPKGSVPGDAQAQVMAQPAETPTGWDVVGDMPIPTLTREQMQDVANIVQRVSGLSEVNFRSIIEVPRNSDAARVWGEAGEGNLEASGFYSTMADIIGVSMRAPGGGRQTAFHEAFHRVQSKFLNEQERALLARERPTLEALVAMKRVQPERMSQKEIEAEAFAIWSEIMETDGAAFGVRLHIGIRRAWARLIQMFERVRNYLRGEGFRTWEDVFETARTGKMKERPEGTAPASGATFYQAETPEFQIMPTAEELARVPASTPPRAVPGAVVTQRINRVLRAGTTLAKKTFKDDRRTVGDDEGARDYVTRKMVDYLLPVLRMQQKVSKNLTELNDAYLNARVAEDAALAQIQTMHDTYVKPMVDALASAGVQLEDFHKYLYALHVEERNEVVGLRHKPDSELFKAIDNHDLKGASGWSTNEAKAVLAELRGDPERWRALRQAGAYIRAMIDVELRNAKRAGLISDETYDILTTQWKNYVPMKGQDGMDDDGFWRPGAGGFDVRGQEHKTALGRFSEAENVIAHAIMQNETSILRQHKNTVGKAMLRFVNQFDPSGDDIAEVYWAGKDGFGDIEKADDIWKRRIGRDGKVEWYRVPNPFASRDDVLATKVGGKTYWIKFHDPKVGLALRKLSKTEISGISKIMRPITVWQSIVNTRANPAFTPINIIRDVLTGSVHLLDENFNVGQVAGIVKNIPKAWGGLWRQFRGTAGDAEWDRLAREYMDAGGRITFHGYADLEKTLNNLQREVVQAIEGKHPMRKAWDALTGFIGQINDVGENGIRLAAYAAARKQGRTAKESAFMARDLTVDFKKHGDWGQEFNSWFVFFNAALQGNVNIVTRMARSKAVRRAVASFVFVGLMEHFWNSLMAGEDDDGESYYRKMLINEPWKLERQFVFFIPGSGGKYVSFPMPYGYNAFHHMGVQAGAVMSGDKGALPATLDALRVYADAFNPIGSGSIVSMISPTVADPVIDILSNENFAGNPIYPSENPFDRSPDPQSYRSFSTTHPAFKTTAEWLNWLSGGTEVEPGAVDIHPDTLEHLWGWATGGLGRFLTDTTSVAGNALEGEFEPKSTPWVKNFYGEIDGDSQRTEYFRERERVLAVEGYLKAYGERGDGEAVRRFQERNKVELEALGAFKAAEKQRREISKERRRIEAARMPEAQREKALEALDRREADAMRMARTAFSRAEDQ